MIKGRIKSGNLYLVGVLFLEMAVFGSMVWNSRSISQMFYILMMGVVFIIPCIKEIAKSPSSMSMPFSNPNNTNSSTNTSNDVRQAEKTVTELKDYKKTNSNNKKKEVSTKGYQEFNNLFKASIQNKLIKRNDVLKLKYEIRHILGTKIEIYLGKNSEFEFDNDAHEINVLSKDSVLKEKDYLYLINLLKNSMDLSSAEEVVE